MGKGVVIFRGRADSREGNTKFHRQIVCVSMCMAIFFS